MLNSESTSPTKDGAKMGSSSAASIPPPSSPLRTPRAQITPRRIASWNGTPRTQRSVLHDSVHTDVSEEISAAVSQQQNQIFKLKTGLDALRGQLADCEEERSGWQCRISAVECERHVATRQLEDAQEQLRLCQRELAVQRKASEEVQLASCVITAERDELMLKVTEAWQRVAALTALTSASTSDKNALEDALQQVSGQTQRQVADLQSQVTTLQTRITELTRERDAAESQRAKDSLSLTRSVRTVTEAVEDLNRYYHALLTDYQHEGVHDGGVEGPTDGSKLAALEAALDSALTEARSADAQQTVTAILAAFSPALRGTRAVLRRMQSDVTMLRSQLRGSRSAHDDALDSREAVHRARSEWSAQREALEKAAAASAQELALSEEAVRRAEGEDRVRCRALAVTLSCSEDWTLIRHRVAQLAQQCRDSEDTCARQQQQQEHAAQSSLKLIEAAEETHERERRLWDSERQSLVARLKALQDGAMAASDDAAAQGDSAMVMTPRSSEKNSSTSADYEKLKSEYAEALRCVEEELEPFAQSQAHQVRQMTARLAVVEAERKRLAKEVVDLQGVIDKQKSAAGSVGAAINHATKVEGRLLLTLSQIYSGLAKDFGEVIHQRRALVRCFDAYHRQYGPLVSVGDASSGSMPAAMQRWAPQQQRKRAPRQRLRAAVIAILVVNRLNRLGQPAMKECLWTQHLPTCGCPRVCHRLRLPIEARAHLSDTNCAQGAPSQRVINAVEWASNCGSIASLADDRDMAPALLAMIADTVSHASGAAGSGDKGGSVMPLHARLQAGLTQHRDLSISSLSAHSTVTANSRRVAHYGDPTATRQQPPPPPPPPPSAHASDTKRADASPLWDSPLTAAPSTVMDASSALGSATPSERVYAAAALATIGSPPPIHLRGQPSAPAAMGPAEVEAAVAQYRAMGGNAGSAAVPGNQSVRSSDTSAFTAEVLGVIEALDRRVAKALQRGQKQ